MRREKRTSWRRCICVAWGARTVPATIANSSAGATRPARCRCLQAKADEGHDQNISKEEIIAQGIVDRDDYETMERYTKALFERGSRIAAEKGLILVDTKYEFGKRDGKVILIDEIHTPDSSRYFYADGYQERFEAGQPQRQLSKEFVRQWLIDHNFMGKAGQTVPEMTDDYCNTVSARYIELYEHITGNKFQPDNSSDIAERIRKNVTEYLSSLEA